MSSSSTAAESRLCASVEDEGPLDESEGPAAASDASSAGPKERLWHREKPWDCSAGLDGLGSFKGPEEPFEDASGGGGGALGAADEEPSA